ncbi:MAG: M23 family metallopeptidase [Novosphingobium sp.]|nr:M23 family metallopeptidase [Novosphingobium sp.]
MRRALLLSGLAALLATTPVLAQTPPEEETEHVVKPGETLGGIASRARVPRILIAEANGLKPPYTLKAGQTLKIPRTRHHTVKRGETGFTIAYIHAVPWRAIAVANGMEPDAPIQPGQKLLIPTIIDQPDGGAAVAASAPASTTSTVGEAPAWRWPLSGTVRRGYAPRTTTNYHDGMDIRAPEGTAVRSTAAGKVIFAGREPAQFGNMAVVDHGNGWHSAYAFLSRLTVKQGDEVSAGERVGLVGSTGQAKGNELHFELRRNNRPVDPTAHLPPRN